jgi:ATP phosphoribosyltransferase regulatory subunit
MSRPPIPPGTRDVLADEMRELRALEDALREVFERFGYAEVATPAIEYLETAYRAVRPQRGQAREFRQAGIELVGVEAPDGTAEIIEVLAAALDAVGLDRAVIGLGDADLYGQLLDGLEITGERRQEIIDRLAAHDFVGLGAAVEAAEGLDDRARETLVGLPGLRGDRSVFEQARALGGPAVERATARLAATYDAVAERGVADRVQLDLGLLRDLGYYTGAIVEVYDPALGHVLGGGGRYDSLVGRFGRDLPAAGFALYTERLHIAQAEEERMGEGT